MSDLEARGWTAFDPDPRMQAWADAARKQALIRIDDAANAQWLRCGGTWFVGVNLLDTHPDGACDGVTLAGPAIDVLAQTGALPAAWDRAQVSVIYPGYPKPGAGETTAAARYRRDRDAAHVDGLLPVGADRRRVLGEAHGFILGIPLNSAEAQASPMVIWEGSHKIIGPALSDVLRPHPPARWPEIDVTELYLSARRAGFDRCPRRVVTVPVGGAYLIHRHALHGVAPWEDGARAAPEGRMIAYFRPEIPMVRWPVPAAPPPAGVFAPR